MNSTNLRIRSEILLLLAFCGFLFFYGLGSFGLVGADEPRYAQIAREMLNRSEWITPILDGQPWLEKPPLYYWQAMLSYKASRAFGSASSSPSDPSRDGVNETTARLPCAIDAALMIAAIYFFLRRFHPGTELDGSLVTAGSVGVIAFAHAAATDMPLAATFTIALLSWYAWYTGGRYTGGRYAAGRRSLLAFFYFFLALGTLAKGPVAPALAAVIVLVFAAAKRELSLIRRTLWLPGILLFFLVALPWYVSVQIRNPEFFRFFILEHNLARFSTNVYHHPQPFWFYLPVFLLAAMPWTVWLVAAAIECIRDFWMRTREMGAEQKTAVETEPRQDTESSAGPGLAGRLFLLIWMLVPIIFFSVSRSKLPGYILPALPPGALLATDYLAIDSLAKNRGRSIPRFLAVAHGFLCGALAFAALTAGEIMIAHHLTASRGTFVAAAIGIVIALAISIALTANAGPGLVRSGLVPFGTVRSATMIAIIVSVASVVRLAAPAIDATQSARPVAAIIQSFSREPVPVALYHVGRTTQYGLDFYLNRPAANYDVGNVPDGAHVLVAAASTESGFRSLLGSRKVSYLTSIPAKKLDIYWVGK